MKTRAISLGLCVVLVSLVGLSSYADDPPPTPSWSANAWKVWFPFINVFEREGSHATPAWPVPGSLYNIHDNTVDNAVWDPDTEDGTGDRENVYYPDGGAWKHSYFDRGGGEQHFRLSLCNPTATNYSRLLGNPIKISFFEISGALVTADTKWTVASGTEPYLLNTTIGDPSPLRWNSTEHCFEFTLNAGTSFSFLDCWSTLGFFNDPGAAVNPTFRGSMCVWQDDGGKFMAEYHGRSHGHWRDDMGYGLAYLNSGYCNLAFGHAGIREDRYDSSGPDNTIIRPHFMEVSELKRNATTSPSIAALDQSEIIYLINASDSEDTVEITCYQYLTEIPKNAGNNEFDGTYSITLDPRQRIAFMPSQFFHPDDDTDRKVTGRMEIVGQRPMAVSLSMYHSRTTDVVGPYDYQHHPAGHMFPFHVENDY